MAVSTRAHRYIRFTCVVALVAAAIGARYAVTRHKLNRHVVSGFRTGSAQGGIAERYGRLPLAFERNIGQTDSQVQFIARGGGSTTFLTGTSAVVSLHPTPPRRPRQPVTGSPATPASTVRLQLTGIQPGIHMTGADPLPGVSHYFIGSDPKAWRSNVATYGRVRSHDVYPGIDVEYYGNQRQLEHDFIVSPGADAGRIAFDVDGADSLGIDRDGVLVISVGAQQVRLEKPFAYQEIGGTRREVSSAYALDGARSVRFQLGAYDRSRTLVIDPVLAYNANFGGSGIDFGLAIAVDSSGNAYVAGGTGSNDFPTTNGVAQTGFGGGTGVFAGFPIDAFVAKLNPTGTSLTWATYLGGSGDDIAFGIAIDETGAAYIAGATAGTDSTHDNFPTTNGAYQTSYGGGNVDMFVTKLNAGGQLAYSTYIGGQCHENATDIAIDAAHNVYLSGIAAVGDPACTQDFPVTPGAFKTTPDAFTSSDGLLVKLNATGSTLLYATYLGGPTQGLEDFANGIAVDGSGNAYVVGGTAAADFPTTGGAYQTTFAGGGRDGFVSKINPAGGGAADLIYSTFLGGSNDFDTISRIALDGSGNAYVTGRTFSTNFPTTAGAYQRTFGGFRDGFVAKLNSTASTLVFSTFFGGSGDDYPVGIALDASQNVYVAGETTSLNLPTTPDALSNSYNGSGSSGFCDTDPASGTAGCDGFIVKLNSTGSVLIYSSYLGGPGDDIPQGIAVQGSNAYLTGGTSSSFLASTTIAGPSLSGPADAFVWKFALPAVGFTDDPVRGASTMIKAVHINELRSRIDAVRIAHGLAAYAYTDPALTPGSTTIKAAHITDLRTALSQAYAAAGLTTPEFVSNPAITPGTTIVRAGDINQLRRLVVGLEEGLGFAVYDGATYMTTACLQVGSVCDSQSLLVGRDTIAGGNEPHQPNTIGGSCVDGTSGTFHVNASNDRIRVSTLDGTPFAPGKTVRVEAFVWAVAAGVNHLDLYYAADAGSPAWTYITTIDAPAAGPQTMSATYTLPAGSVQAVRARFRSGGAPASCTGSTSGFDDHDDLVFAVGP